MITRRRLIAGLAALVPVAARPRLPTETQHHVAYRSAWSLLFGEAFA